MCSIFQTKEQDYLHLKKAVDDFNKLLQDKTNYDQFDSRIRTAILSENDDSIPNYIYNLPQVRLIKTLRRNIDSFAKDFAAKDYTKAVKLLMDVWNSIEILEDYRLAKQTICFSPEFNTKVLSFVRLLIDSRHIFQKEITKISYKPLEFFKNVSSTPLNDNNISWYHYLEKIRALLHVMSDSNKLKPYVQNLERLITFIINLKEKGVLKSNFITTFLDFVESFNKLSETTLKEIMKEYAIFTEQEIKKFIQQGREFWSAFLPICDEVEINAGLKGGYLTERLNPLFKFCNILDKEFDNGDSTTVYPFTQARLTRINHSVQQTEELLKKEQEHIDKLCKLEKLVNNILEGNHIDTETLNDLHEFVALLNCDDSYKTSFHQLINNDLAVIAKKVSEQGYFQLQYQALLSKYKSHEASLKEAQALFFMPQMSVFTETPQDDYMTLLNEYTEFKDNTEAYFKKIANGLLPAKDIMHLTIMINIFETFEEDRDKKLASVKEEINKQVTKLHELQTSLTLFTKSELPDCELFVLLSNLDLLDCDESIKEKYKKQIADLDDKRKNGGRLRSVKDFLFGLVSERTVPFDEINCHVRDKIALLNRIIEKSDISEEESQDIYIREIPDLPNETIDMFVPNAIIDQSNWLKLKEQVRSDLHKNQCLELVLESAHAYQKERLETLKGALLSYQAPDTPRVVKPPETLERITYKKTILELIKKAVSSLTNFFTYGYSSAKAIINKVRSVFKSNEELQNQIPIIRQDDPNPSLLKSETIDISPYYELNFIEDNLSLALRRIINPAYHETLEHALHAHKRLPLTDDMPYFYREGAEIVNIYILFRKCILSFSLEDMLRLSVALGNLNAENQFLLKFSLENITTFNETSSYFKIIVAPFLSKIYKTAANLIPKADIKTHSIQTIHQALLSMKANTNLDLHPMIIFLNSVGEKYKADGKPLDADLMKIYSSINKLTHFAENMLNNQKNIVIEALFHLSDLIHQFRQISASVTSLLIRDEFPYLKELSTMMQSLLILLDIYKANIIQLQADGLHPSMINALQTCVNLGEHVAKQFTPLKFKQARLLLQTEAIKSSLFKYSPDRIYKKELDNIRLLLTNPSDEKLIDDKQLDSVNKRLNEIEESLKKSSIHNWLSSFSNWQPISCLKQNIVKIYVPENANQRNLN